MKHWSLKISVLAILILIVCRCEEAPLEPLAIIGSYTIAFSLEDSADVYIDIENRYDTIVNHIDRGRLPGGPHSITWDRLDKNGAPLLPGLYFLRLSIDGEHYSRTLAVYHLESGDS